MIDNRKEATKRGIVEYLQINDIKTLDSGQAGMTDVRPITSNE